MPAFSFLASYAHFLADPKGWVAEPADLRLHGLSCSCALGYCAASLNKSAEKFIGVDFIEEIHT
jgi:hypothetical protein